MSIELTIISVDLDSNYSPSKAVFSSDLVSIGRSQNNDIVLDAPEISEKHATIKLVKDTISGIEKLVVSDLGSLNGTKVENRLVRPRAEEVVRPTERVLIGSYILKPMLVRDDNAVVNNKNKQIVKEEIKIKNMENGERQLTGAPSRETRENFSLESRPLRNFAEPAAAPVSSGSFNISTNPETPILNRRGTSASIVVKVNGSDVTSVNFSATRVFSISGKIIHNGVALSGVEVEAGSLGKTVTGPDGSFVFNNVPENSDYTITAKKDGYLLTVTK